MPLVERKEKKIGKQNKGKNIQKRGLAHSTRLLCTQYCVHSTVYTVITFGTVYTLPNVGLVGLYCDVVRHMCHDSFIYDTPRYSIFRGARLGCSMKPNHKLLETGLF